MEFLVHLQVESYFIRTNEMLVSINCYNRHLRVKYERENFIPNVEFFSYVTLKVTINLLPPGFIAYFQTTQCLKTENL